MNDFFKGIIGQTQAKRELGFYLNAYQHSRILPNMMIVAPKGQGKTTIAEAVMKGLYRFNEDGTIMEGPSKSDPKRIRPECKKMIPVNCSEIKGLKGFINNYIIKNVQDKDVTLFFDEASELPHDVSMAMLSMLNPNPENRNIYTYEEYTCELDFRRQSFIFATSEPHKVFHALLDRLERITLQDYSLTELSEIVQKGLGDVKCEDDVLLEVAPTLRGNARAAQKMAGKILSYLRGAKKFDVSCWHKLCKILSIYPLGLNSIEIQLLRFLAENMNGTSLTALAAKTGMSREALQKDTELYLQKHGLMEIETSGRMITPKGLKYVQALA